MFLDQNIFFKMATLLHGDEFQELTIEVLEKELEDAKKTVIKYPTAIFREQNNLAVVYLQRWIDELNEVKILLDDELYINWKKIVSIKKRFDPIYMSKFHQDKYFKGKYY